MIQSPKCPMMKFTQIYANCIPAGSHEEFLDCVLSKCAWYDRKTCTCAILNISETLGKELTDES